MLMGIALHSAMSFFGAPWPVQDSQQLPLLGLLVASIHGFRMALFFLVSGFFTAMLWRKRGAMALLKQRTQRVLIPLLIGLVTIIPLFRWVSSLSIPSTAQPPVIRSYTEGQDPNARDPQFGATLLSWAAMQGDLKMTQKLLEKGADINATNTDGSTPLHSAVFIGREMLCRYLLDHGANPLAHNANGQLPAQTANLDLKATMYLMGMLQLPPRSPEDIQKGRDLCLKMLPPTPLPTAGIAPGSNSLRDRYLAFVTGGNLSWLFTLSLFEHLWFLWFLCWMIGFFLIWTVLEDKQMIPTGQKFRSWIITPRRFLWLIPLSCMAQYFMGMSGPTLGPDTATGLIPPPHLLFYYGIFFFFGALYYDADDREGALGSNWAIALSIAMLVAFPVGMATLTWLRPVSDLFQVCYAWLMVCGTIGLFRKLLRRENSVLRYLSDASYWMYLAHLPLVVYLQQVLSPLPLPGILKLALILTVSSAFLLLTYQFCVRYTPIGVLLNGRRAIPEKKLVANQIIKQETIIKESSE